MRQRCVNHPEKLAKARGRCQPCYREAVLVERLAAGDLCSFPGCPFPRLSTNGLCRSHDRQRLSGKELQRVRVYEPRDVQPDGSVRCRICRQNKPPDDYRVSSTQCTRCHGLASRYGMTPDQLEKMLADQGGCCAICGTDEPGGRWNVWHVDHDHRCCPTGYTCGACVKGALCNNCNMGLGFFRNSPDVLSQAAAYAAESRSG